MNLVIGGYIAATYMYLERGKLEREGLVGWGGKVLRLRQAHRIPLITRWSLLSWRDGSCVTQSRVLNNHKCYPYLK